MAGKVCPQCGQATLFISLGGRTCTQCGFKAIVPVSAGKGKKCVTCGKFQVFNNTCNGCGTKYIEGRK